MAATASGGGQAVEKQLKNCGFKRTVHVLVLYLAGQCSETFMCVTGSVSSQQPVKKPWQNSEGIERNDKLADPEQYLVFILQNNLFHNPLAQDPDYWLYVVHLLPSVQLLVRKSVTQRERELALHLHQYKRSGVMQSVAFGKRVDTPLETTVGSSRCTQPARRVMMPSDSEFGNQRNKEPFENPKDAVLLRAMARSVMEFSYVDWNSVATSQERQLKNKAATEVCKKLTVQFR